MTVDAAEAEPRETATAAVSCVALTYRFGPHTAVDHVNLTIAPGEMFGLLGPNGAGKPKIGIRHFFPGDPCWSDGTLAGVLYTAVFLEGPLVAVAMEPGAAGGYVVTVQRSSVVPFARYRS